jgi:2-isopropylmalate synthase
VPKSSIILTSRSGRAALAFRAKEIGYNLTKDELDTAYNSFLLLADAQKEVHDQDLEKLLKDKVFA